MGEKIKGWREEGRMRMVGSRRGEGIRRESNGEGDIGKERAMRKVRGAVGGGRRGRWGR